MKTVLFLGAGATRAQWEHEYETTPELRDQVWTRQSVAVPITRDFLDLAAERCANDFPYVREYFMRKRRTLPPNVETAFSRVLDAALNGDRCARCAWHHFQVCYRKLIGVSTNALCLKGGPMVSLYRGVVESSTGLTVLTTNQDLVMERIMICQRRMDHRSVEQDFLRCLSQGISSVHTAYGVSLERVLRVGAKESHPVLSPSGWPNVKVLKLHGSLNWWYASTEEFDPSPQETTRGLLWSYEPLVEVGHAVLYNPSRRLGPKQWAYPLVVPWSRFKWKFFKDRLKPVHRQAKKALAACESLVVLGYGFAPQDKAARGLFQTNLNKNVRAISVIDKNDTAAKRLIHLRDHVKGPAGDGGKVKYFKCVDDHLCGKETEIHSTCPECGKPIVTGK